MYQSNTFPVLKTFADGKNNDILICNLTKVFCLGKKYINDYKENKDMFKRF